MLITACGSQSPSASSPISSGTTSISPLGSPSSTIKESPQEIWATQGVDPAPGSAVVGTISGILAVPYGDVEAAVFLLRHPAGNGAEVWAFRSRDLTSDEAIERWALGHASCGPPAERGSLAGLESIMIRRVFSDQCQPQYLVKLDDDTLAVITDDGGYAGNDPAAAPTVPYRPASEIASLVSWLQWELEQVELKPGGPPPVQG